MKNKRRKQGYGTLDLIEEAVHLLRTAPPATLAIYYLGAVPFITGLLFFWTDMSRNPFAVGRLADASLGMGLLFFWMKFWQAVFARRMRAQRAAMSGSGLGFRQALRILQTQMIWQSSGLFLIPLSILPILPFPWVYAFYQNVTALDDGEARPGEVFKKSCRQATLWPAQNLIALLILIGFGIFILWNCASVCFSLPEMFKTLFGIESKFTHSQWGLVNSTFFAAMYGLTYLCLDPILKTVYVLRCFYGESLESGEDLKAELKRMAATVSRAAAAVLLVSTIVLSTPAFAADNAAPAKAPAPSGISAGQLDGAIDQTIHERKYIYRLPREKIEVNANEGPVAHFFDKIWDMLKRWSLWILKHVAKGLLAVLHWLGKLWDSLFGGPHSYSPGSSNHGWTATVQLLLWMLLVVVAGGLAIFVFRVWQGRREPRSPVVSEAILPVPDIADENTAADQLPEEEWTKLGRELLARGELRLAMRAFYLASLSHLAARNLIRIARFKSNREYERELRRRGHSFPELLSVFGQNISAFEATWYGMHETDPDSVNQFALNVEKLRSAG